MLNPNSSAKVEALEPFGTSGTSGTSTRNRWNFGTTLLGTSFWNLHLELLLGTSEPLRIYAWNFGPSLLEPFAVARNLGTSWNLEASLGTLEPFKTSPLLDIPSGILTWNQNLPKPSLGIYTCKFGNLWNPSLKVRNLPEPFLVDLGPLLGTSEPRGTLRDDLYVLGNNSKNNFQADEILNVQQQCLSQSLTVISGCVPAWEWSRLRISIFSSCDLQRSDPKRKFWVRCWKKNVRVGCHGCYWPCNRPTCRPSHLTCSIFLSEPTQNTGNLKKTSV